MLYVNKISVELGKKSCKVYVKTKREMGNKDQGRQ